MQVLRPPDGSFFIGDLPRGRVVRWDDSGRTAKIVDQYSGSTLVKVKKPTFGFVPTSGPSAGRMVTIKGGTETYTVSKNTVVRPHS